MKESKLELTLLAGLQDIESPYKLEREYKFHPKRKWRFDFAYPEIKLAIEAEGGVFTGGRHTRSSGFIKDTEKYNQAAFDGWTVFRFASPDIYSDKAKEFIEKYIETKRPHL